MAVYLNKLTGDGANLLTPRRGSLILYYDTTNNTLKVKDDDGVIHDIDSMIDILSVGVDNVLDENGIKIGGNNTSFAIGQGNEINNISSLAVGSYNELNGEQNLASGSFNKIDGEDSVAFGKYTYAKGNQSMSGGQGSDANHKVLSEGESSFNYSHVDATYTENGNQGDYSAILGGTNNTIKSEATRSVVLGGENIIADEKNTTYTDNLVCLSYLRIGNDTVGISDEDKAKGEIPGTLKYEDDHLMGYVEVISNVGTKSLGWKHLDQDTYVKSYYWGHIESRDPITGELLVTWGVPNTPKEENQTVLRFGMSEGNDIEIDLTQLSRYLKSAEFRWNSSTTHPALDPSDPLVTGDEYNATGAVSVLMMDDGTYLELDQTDIFNSKLDKIGGKVTGDIEVMGGIEVHGKSVLHDLEVPDTFTIKNLIVKDNATIGDDNGTDVMTVNSKTFFLGEVEARNNLITADLLTKGNVTIGESHVTKLDVNSTTEFINSVKFDALSTFDGEAIHNGEFKTTNNTYLGNDVNADQVHISSITNLYGKSNFDGEVLMKENVLLNKNILVEGTTTSKEAHINEVLTVDDKTITNKLEVVNDSSLNNVNVNGALNVDGVSVFNEDTRVGNPTDLKSFTVVGDLNVTRNVVLGTSSSTPPCSVVVNANTSLGGDLTMTNSNAKVTASNLEIDGKLIVDGDSTLGNGNGTKTTLKGDLVQTGVGSSATFEANVAINGDTKANVDLLVGRNMTVNGNASIHGELRVDNTVHLLDTINVDKRLNVSLGANIGSEGLTVQGDTNIVGETILTGETTVKSNLNVNDNAIINDDLTVDGLSTLKGKVTMNDDLLVNQQSEFKNTATFENGITVTGGNTSLSSDLTVGSGIRGSVNNKNTQLNGALSVLDDVDITGDLIVRENLTTSGTTNLKSTIIDSDLVVSNNVTLGTSSSDLMTVNGKTLLKDDVEIYPSKKLKAGGDVLVEGTSEFKNSITVDENSTFNKNLSVIGNTTTDSRTTTKDLTVNDTATINGILDVNNNTTIDGDFEVKVGHTTNLKGNLNVSGLTTFNEPITVVSGQKSTLGGDVEIAEDLIVNGSTTNNGVTTINNTLDVSGTYNTSLGGELSVGGITVINNNFNVPNNKITGETLSITSTSVKSDFRGGISVLNDTELTNLNVSGTTDLNGALDVTGSGKFESTLEVLGDLIQKGRIVSTNDVLLQRGLVVSTNDGDFQAGLKVTGGNLDVTNNVNINKNLVVSDDSTFNGNVNLGNQPTDDITVNGKLIVLNTLDTEASTTSIFNGKVETKNEVILGVLSDDTVTINGDVKVNNSLSLERNSIKFKPNTGTTPLDFNMSGQTTLGSDTKPNLNWNNDRIVTDFTFKDKNIEELKNVETTNVQEGDFLAMSSGKYKNRKLVKADVSDYLEGDYVITGSLTDIPGDQDIYGKKYFKGDVDISGTSLVVKDLTVTGTNTVTEATNLAINNKLIVTNHGETGAGISGTDISGFIIDRGTAQSFGLFYSESSKSFRGGYQDPGTINTSPAYDHQADTFTADSFAIAERSDELTPILTVDANGVIQSKTYKRENGLAYWNGSRFNASDFLQFVEADRSFKMTDGSFSLKTNTDTLLSLDSSSNTMSININNVSFTGNINSLGDISSVDITSSGVSNLAVLNTNGLSTLNSLEVTNNANVSSNLSVSGTTQTNTITNTNNISTNTLSSTGLSTLNSLLVNTNINATGNIIASGNLTSNGLTNTGLLTTDTITTTGISAIAGMNVSGVSTFAQNVSFSTGTITTVNGTLNINGVSNFSNTATFTNDVRFNNDVTLSSGANLITSGIIQSTTISNSGIITISGLSNLNGGISTGSTGVITTNGLTVTNNVANFNSGASVTGDLNISGKIITNNSDINSLVVNNSALIKSDLTLEKDLTVNGDVILGSNTTKTVKMTGSGTVDKNFGVTENLTVGINANISGVATVGSIVVSDGLSISDGIIRTYNSYTPLVNRDIIDFEYLTTNYKTSTFISDNYINKTGDAILTGKLTINNNDFEVDQKTTTNSLVVSTNAIIGGTTTLENTLTVNSNSIITGTMNVGGISTLGTVEVNNLTTNYTKFETLSTLLPTHLNGTVAYHDNNIKAKLNGEWVLLNTVPVAIANSTANTLSKIDSDTLPSVNDNKIINVDVNSIYYQDMANFNYTKLMEEHNKLKADYESLISLLKTQKIIA